MGEWKAPLLLRVRQEFRRELEEAAAEERRARPADLPPPVPG
jgi:hypothetical protein